MADMVTPSASFWRGKRVFLTGHTGFKGAWLGLWLLHLGAEVHGFSLEPDTEPSLFRLTGLSQAMVSTIGDIRDQACVLNAMREARPDVVLHLAAQSLVRRSYQQPVETFATNVMGTVHVLDAATRTGTAAVLIVTTDKCYDNREWVWPYREIDPLGGADPYSASKACAELATNAWRLSRGFFPAHRQSSQQGIPAIASARAGNVIGGGDWAQDRLVPDCVRAITAGESIVIRRPNAVRPWQHVLEPLSGYLLLAQRLLERAEAAEEAWNFGPDGGNAVTVEQVVNRVVKHWGGGASWQRDAAAHPHEAGLLAVDSTKARMKLAWSPRLGIDETVRWTVNWYRRHASGESAADLVREQIATYERLGPLGQ